MIDLKSQMFISIIFSLLVAASFLLAKNLILTIFIAILGIFALLYLKGNQTITKLIDKFI